MKATMKRIISGRNQMKVGFFFFFEVWTGVDGGFSSKSLIEELTGGDTFKVCVGVGINWSEKSS